MPIFVISIIIQLALVVHILKTGRNSSWVFIVLIFPLIGSLAYFIVELLPELTGSRTGRSVQRNVLKTINPDKDLNIATQNLDVADTVQNSMALAARCIEKEKYAEAKELYLRCLKGVHIDDPDILLGVAQAQFGLGEYQGVIQTLDTVKEKNPQYKSADGHLLYARAHEALGNVAAASHEYEVLITYYPGPEPACRFAQLLKANGNVARANELFQKIMKESKHAGRHYNSLHKEWVALAQRELQ